MARVNGSPATRCCTTRDEDYYHLAPPPWPQPVFGLAADDAQASRRAELSEALARLMEEDPASRSASIRATAAPWCVAWGEQQHLRSCSRSCPPALEPAARHRNAEHPLPRDDHRSRRGRATATSRAAAPAGSARSPCASSRYRAAPASSSATRSKAAPSRPLHAGVEKGVRQALIEGALAGFPLRDLRVGDHRRQSNHAVDSNKVSFVTASRHALLEAVLAAHDRSCSSRVARRAGEGGGYSSARSARNSPAAVGPHRDRQPGAGVDVDLGARADGRARRVRNRLKAICAGEASSCSEASGHDRRP